MYAYRAASASNRAGRLSPCDDRSPMKWVTRERPKTDRVACPWLIRRFIDPEAEIVYVPGERVLDVAREAGGRSFDTPGADFTHRGNRCTFEVLIEEFGLDRKSTRLNSSHSRASRMPSSA